VAFVVAQTGSQVTASELDTHCLSEIARFKRPREYRSPSSLPKSNYGKVLKRELQAELISTSKAR